MTKWSERPVWSERKCIQPGLWVIGGHQIRQLGTSGTWAVIRLEGGQIAKTDSFKEAAKALIDEHLDQCDCLKPCSCGARDYASCLCNLSPAEWMEHAKTHPHVDPSVWRPDHQLAEGV